MLLQLLWEALGLTTQDLADSKPVLDAILLYHIIDGAAILSSDISGKVEVSSQAPQQAALIVQGGNSRVTVTDQTSEAVNVVTTDLSRWGFWSYGHRLDWRGCQRSYYRFGVQEFYFLHHLQGPSSCFAVNIVVVIIPRAFLLGRQARNFHFSSFQLCCSFDYDICT
eukprot:TRINITY_DN2725_c0_g1_i4.p2 TRINITY_DN2725_c0_g1~~TRINITY_DN2725_c0_g1_i4.p2  ORF type:complete len:167 (-),score=8.16 TRINITY_DN2725_c0_g1_i4:228-728(-)